MYQYFAFNIIYSLLVFGYLYSLKTAPFRVRLRFVLLAMVSWLLPYDLINGYFTQNNPMVLSSTISNFNSTIKHAIISQVEPKTFLTLLNTIKLMSLFGLLLFIKDMLSLKLKINRIRHKSTLYKQLESINIYQLNDSDNAFTVRLFNPRIYIGDKLIRTSAIDSIIAHEIQHIKSKDQFWLLLITFVQRLLWWNPIVYLLAEKGRDYIELSCDQLCKEANNDNNYQADLAQLLIDQHKAPSLLISHMLGKSKQNIYRIKQLSKEFKMNKKHKALIFSTALIPFVLMLLVSTNTVSSENNHKDDGKKTTILENQVDLEYSISVSKQHDKREIKTRFIAEYDKKYSLGRKTKAYYPPGHINEYQGVQMIDFDFEITLKYVDEKTIMINAYVAIENNSEELEYHPSLLVEAGKEASITVGDKGLDIKLIVKPIF